MTSVYTPSPLRRSPASPFGKEPPSSVPAYVRQPFEDFSRASVKYADRQLDRINLSREAARDPSGAAVPPHRATEEDDSDEDPPIVIREHAHERPLPVPSHDPANDSVLKLVYFTHIPTRIDQGPDMSLVHAKIDEMYEDATNVEVNARPISNEKIFTVLEAICPVRAALGSVSGPNDMLSSFYCAPTAAPPPPSSSSSSPPPPSSASSAPAPEAASPQYGRWWDPTAVRWASVPPVALTAVQWAALQHLCIPAKPDFCRAILGTAPFPIDSRDPVYAISLIPVDEFIDAVWWVTHNTAPEPWCLLLVDHTRVTQEEVVTRVSRILLLGLPHQESLEAWCICFLQHLRAMPRPWEWVAAVHERWPSPFPVRKDGYLLSTAPRCHWPVFKTDSAFLERAAGITTHLKTADLNAINPSTNRFVFFWCYPISIYCAAIELAAVSPFSVRTVFQHVADGPTWEVIAHLPRPGKNYGPRDDLIGMIVPFPMYSPDQYYGRLRACYTPLIPLTPPAVSAAPKRRTTPRRVSMYPVREHIELESTNRAFNKLAQFTHMADSLSHLLSDSDVDEVCIECDFKLDGTSFNHFLLLFLLSGCYLLSDVSSCLCAVCKAYTMGGYNERRAMRRALLRRNIIMHKKLVCGIPRDSLLAKVQEMDESDPAGNTKGVIMCRLPRSSATFESLPYSALLMERVLGAEKDKFVPAFEETETKWEHSYVRASATLHAITQEYGCDTQKMYATGKYHEQTRYLAMCMFDSPCPRFKWAGTFFEKLAVAVTKAVLASSRNTTALHGTTIRHSATMSLLCYIGDNADPSDVGRIFGLCDRMRDWTHFAQPPSIGTHTNWDFHYLASCARDVLMSPHDGASPTLLFAEHLYTEANNSTEYIVMKRDIIYTGDLVCISRLDTELRGAPTDEPTEPAIKKAKGAGKNESKNSPDVESVTRTEVHSSSVYFGDLALKDILAAHHFNRNAPLSDLRGPCLATQPISVCSRIKKWTNQPINAQCEGGVPVDLLFSLLLVQYQMHALVSRIKHTQLYYDEFTAGPVRTAPSLEEDDDDLIFGTPSSAKLSGTVGAALTGHKRTMAAEEAAPVDMDVDISVPLLPQSASSALSVPRINQRATDAVVCVLVDDKDAKLQVQVPVAWLPSNHIWRLRTDRTDAIDASEEMDIDEYERWRDWNTYGVIRDFVRQELTGRLTRSAARALLLGFKEYGLMLHLASHLTRPTHYESYRVTAAGKYSTSYTLCDILSAGLAFPGECSDTEEANGASLASWVQSVDILVGRRAKFGPPKIQTVVCMRKNLAAAMMVLFCKVKAHVAPLTYNRQSEFARTAYVTTPRFVSANDAHGDDVCTRSNTGDLSVFVVETDLNASISLKPVTRATVPVMPSSLNLAGSLCILPSMKKRLAAYCDQVRAYIEGDGCFVMASKECHEICVHYESMRAILAALDAPFSRYITDADRCDFVCIVRAISMHGLDSRDRQSCPDHFVTWCGPTLADRQFEGRHWVPLLLLRDCVVEAGQRAGAVFDSDAHAWFIMQLRFVEDAYPLPAVYRGMGNEVTGLAAAALQLYAMPDPHSMLALAGSRAVFHSLGERHDTFMIAFPGSIWTRTWYMRSLCEQVDIHEPTLSSNICAGQGCIGSNRGPVTLAGYRVLLVGTDYCKPMQLFPTTVSVGGINGWVVIQFKEVRGRVLVHSGDRSLIYSGRGVTLPYMLYKGVVSTRSSTDGTGVSVAAAILHAAAQNEDGDGDDSSSDDDISSHSTTTLELEHMFGPEIERPESPEF